MIGLEGIELKVKGTGTVGGMPPCALRGRPTGNTHQGQALYFCRPHGACTLSPAEGAQACAGCAQRVESLPTLTARPSVAERVAQATACVHRGEATGETVQCPTCTGHVSLKLLACDRHGRCTIDKQAAGVACCRICPDRQAPTATSLPG